MRGGERWDETMNGRRLFLPQSQWIHGTNRGLETQHRRLRAYGLAERPGQHLASLLQRANGARPPDLGPEFSLLDMDNRDWKERLTAIREGQGAFRVRLFAAHEVNSRT